MHTQLTPDSDALPFLVIHGGWFWIVLVLLFALVLTALFVLARHMKALVRARANIAWVRTQLVSALPEGRGALAGRWRGDAISIGGDRVELDNGWRVIVGNRGARIDDGAEVIVRGEFRRGTTQADNKDPDNAAAWRVAQAEVYALRSHAPAKPLHWTARFVGFSFALVVAYTTSRFVGSYLNDRFPGQTYYWIGDGNPLHVGELDAISIAASLPGSREKALEHLADALESHPFHDEKSIRRQLALSQLMHGECGDLTILHVRPEAELALARKCGYRRAAFDILVSMGEYESAFESKPADLEWPYEVGWLAIATAHWNEAAVQADTIAARVEAKVAAKNDDNASAQETALEYRCLAQWFRMLAGEADGATKLRQLASTPGVHPVVCAAIVAQTLPPSERVAYLRNALAVPDPADELIKHTLMARIALWLEGDDDDRSSVTFADFDGAIGEGEKAGDQWLLQFGIDRWRHGTDAWNHAIALGGVVLREVHRGDFDAAGRLLQEAAQAAQGPNDTSALEEVRAWSEFLAIRQGQAELPAATSADNHTDVLRLRRGDAPEYSMSDPCDARLSSSLSSAVAAAQHGDGRPLARVLQACPIHHDAFAIPTLLGVLPRVQQGRRELAGALRWWDNPDPPTYDDPFNCVAYAAARRDIARFVDDEESAATWGEMAKRCLKPLEDRTQTLALVLWRD